MHFMGLSKAETKKLELEVISNDARLRLTRLVRGACRMDDSNHTLIRQNRLVNIARTVLGKTIYVLDPDAMGEYMDEEFAWHTAESELIMRRPDTVQLIETLADILQEGLLAVSDVNGVLEQDNSSVRFRSERFEHDIYVEIMALEDLEEEKAEDQHSNFRVLFARMESAFDQMDYSGVLAASSNIFETLVKVVFDNPAVDNQSLGTLFDGYKKRSELPGPVLDYIHGIYKRRNTEPLAGHGALAAPTVTQQEASILIEMTRMAVKLERRLSSPETGASQFTKPSSGN